jgi:AraC-like DNA-binding protein
VAGESVQIPSVLLERLTALGVDVPRLLRHAGLLPSRFQAPRVRLTPHEFFAFWRAVEAVDGRRELGLRLGAEALPHQFDVASLAALHSPTLGEGLERLARYKRIVCGEQVLIERAEGEACIRFHWVHVEEALPLMLVDVAFTAILALARRGLGSALAPRRVELARHEADAALLRHHFGCAVRFDAPVDRLVLEASALERPFLTHNADLLALMVPGLEAQLREHLTSRSLVDDAKALLGRCMSGARPSVESLAQEMRLSRRTLQRRLEEQGTTYQQLLDAVRRDTACRLLRHTGLDTAEIAFLLGFEELNSFSRAFQAWEGTTPARWRHARRPGEAAPDAAHPSNSEN